MSPSIWGVWKTGFLPLFLIAVTVLLFHRSALTYHFWPDDWELVGPAAAAEFLADPSTLVRSFQMFGHYAPLVKAWYVAQSLVFQDHPLPYHVLNLALTVLAAFALFRLFLKFGLPHTGALCGALYFGVAHYNMFVISWITGSNYLWLALLMVLALSSWEDFLGTGEKKHLLAVTLPTLAVQYVHSIGVVLPLLLGARALLSSPNLPPGRGPDRGRAAGIALLLALAAGILQVLPRLLLPTGESPEPNLSLLRLIQTVGMSLGGQLREAAWEWPLGRIVLALSIPLLAAWAVKREHWRVMTLGIIMGILTLIPPVIMVNWPPFVFAFKKMRYMTIPNLGLAFVLGVLVSTAFPPKHRKHPSWALLFLAGAFMTALFIQVRIRSNIEYKLYATQDGYVWKCAEEYRRSFLSLDRKGECRRIVIADVALKQTIPREVNGNLLIQNTNHQTFHRFFRLSEQTGLAVNFNESNMGPVVYPGDCYFLAKAGTLTRY